MTISPSIFKAYDIRGIVPATVNEDVACKLGRAFGTVALLMLPYLAWVSVATFLNYRIVQMNRPFL